MSEFINRYKDRESARKLFAITGGGAQGFQAEKRRTRNLLANIKNNPLAASTMFDPNATPQSANKIFGFFRPLFNKAQRGVLTDAEKAFIDEQTQFGPERGAAFLGLLSRRAEVVKQREVLESRRTSRPGRTQTILTRRE